MSEPITCFWVQRNGAAQRSLRRWVSKSSVNPCPGKYGYHNATVTIETVPLVLSQDKEERGVIGIVKPSEYRDDPRWPQRCDYCDYILDPFDDDWQGVSRFDGSCNQQVGQDPIYFTMQHEPGAYRSWPMSKLPAGAMFDAEWHHGHWMGADGISLAVVTPYDHGDARNGLWIVDGRAKNGGDGPPPHWQRTGDPRAPGSVTATPSIQTSQYHGWLRNGQLVDA